MKTLKLVGVIFALVGAGLLVGSFFSFSSTKSFVASAASATGTVIENRYEQSSSTSSSRSSSGSYYPFIKFSTEAGQEITFRGNVGSNPASFTVGEQVSIYYDPARPEEARLNTFFQLWFLTVFLGGMGSVFFLIGGGILITGPLRARKGAWLRENGQKIQAEITSVNMNTGFAVNGRHPFVIVSQWKDPKTNTIQVFESENLWFDPKEFIQGKTIDVFIDRNNQHKYFVDVSFLPKVAN